MRHTLWFYITYVPIKLDQQTNEINIVCLTLKCECKRLLLFSYLLATVTILRLHNPLSV